MTKYRMNLLIEEIRKQLPEELKNAEIRIEEYSKNNQFLNGLTIRSAEERTCPITYIEPFEMKYGYDLPRMADALVKEYLAVKEHTAQALSDDIFATIRSEDVMSHITLVARGAEQNREMLYHVPHKKVNDIAFVPYLELNEGMQAKMTYDLCEFLELDPKAVLETAEKNLKQSEVFWSPLMGQSMNPELYVLTNTTAMEGAALISDQDLMAQIAEDIGDHYFILPSSIHEVIILQDDQNRDPEELERMVSSINHTQVAPEERLTDHVYRYDAQTKSIELWQENRWINETLSAEKNLNVVEEMTPKM